MDDDVRNAIEQTISFYESHGYEMIEISLPSTDLSIPVYYVIATAEASSNLARYDGIRYTSKSKRGKCHQTFTRRAEAKGSERKSSVAAF